MDESILSILRKTTLFHGIADEGLLRLLHCLGCHKRCYGPGQTIWLSGDRVHWAGIVLSGTVSAERCSHGGSRYLAAQHGQGELFGDVLMSTNSARSPVDILAGPEGTQVLVIPFSKIMVGCEHRCSWHIQLRLNLLDEISCKFWALRRQIECLSAAGLRSRICHLLLSAADEAGKSSFSLPYDRNGMAAYLAVNRSALSRELSRMQAEGLLKYHKNHFSLPDREALASYLD